MHDLVFESNPQGSTHVTRNPLHLAELSNLASNLALILQDLLERRPLIWDLRMVMTLLRVINIWIYAPLEDLRVMAGLRRRQARDLGELDVHKSRNMTEIEDASISEFDGFI
jgi:hypothetical protein